MSSEIRYIYIRACSKAKWKTCRFTLVKKTEGRDWCAEGGVSRIAKFSVTLPVLINCETSHQVSIVIFKTFLMEKKNLFVAPAVFIFLMSWHAGEKKPIGIPITFTLQVVACLFNFFVEKCVHKSNVKTRVLKGFFILYRGTVGMPC